MNNPMLKLLSALKVGEKVCGWVHACDMCGTWFIGRKDAKRCSPKCRKRAERERA